MEITQTLGFDASGAIAQLAALDKALGQLDARLKSTANQLGQFNKVGSATQAAAQKVAAANKTLGQSFRTHLGAANQQTTQLTTSLGLLSRIAFTQFIVSGLNQIENALVSAANRAADFQAQLSLIRTIDGGGSSADQIADRVRRLSDNYNIDLMDAVRANYQATSNQIGETTAETERFLEVAARFSKATGSSFADSVDLLSGAIKSYGLSVADSERVASILFKTIDLGRISASEFANSFGRLGPLAADTGLSMEEMAAALAAISVRGSNTSESLTMLRSITTALLKPSEAMKEALADMGFESGDTALRTLGLAETLRQLDHWTGGSSAKMAALFQNVRGLSGAASLTSDDLQSFKASLIEIQAAGSALEKQKYFTAVDNDGERVRKELRKISNSFVDLGGVVLDVADDALKLVGGADAIIGAFKTAAAPLAGVISMLVSLRGQAILAANSMGSLASSPLLPVAATGMAQAALVQAVGVASGRILGQSMDDTLIHNAEASLKAMRKLHEQELELLRSNQDERLRLAAETSKAQVAITQQTFAAQRKVYLADMEAAWAADSALGDSAKAMLSRIVGAREQFVAQLGKAAAQARELFGDSQQRVADVRSEAGDRAFQNQLRGLDEITAATRRLARAREIARDAAASLVGASDSQGISRALQQFDAAERLADIETDNRGLRTQVERAMLDLTGQRIRAEEQLQRIQASRIPALERERDAQQKVVNGLREQVKVLLDNTSLFGKDGRPLSADKLAERAAKRQEALNKIASTALNQKDLTAAGALGLAQFVSQAQAELSRDPLQLQFVVENGIAKVQQQITDAFSKYQVGLNLKALENVTGRSITSPSDATNALNEAASREATLRKQLADGLVAQERINQIRAEIDETLAGVESRAFNRTLATPESLAAFDMLVNKFRDLRSSANLTEDQVREFFAVMNQFKEGAFSGVRGKIAFTTDLDQMAKAVPSLMEMSRIQPPDMAALRDQLQQTSLAIEAARLDLSMMLSPAATFRQHMEGAASAAERAANALRGTHGVVSPPRFFNSIQPINAAQPVTQQGPVSVNNSVGDIHIHESSSPRATAREVVGAINRHQRINGRKGL